MGAAGIPLAMSDHSAWALASGGESWWLGVEDDAGDCAGGAAVMIRPSRALPGFRILRVERFGAGVAASAQTDTMLALAGLVARQPRVLRLHVECFSLEPDGLAGLMAGASRAGFSRSEAPRCYDRTLLIPLDADLDTLFGRLHATARRHIRAVAKNPVAVRPVTDPMWGGRMDQLLQETLGRTGGVPSPHDWSAILGFSEANPGLSRVVGLFRTDEGGPESLLAFAWGCCHGSHVHYSTAASTRATDLRLPMAYCLVWDLMQWSHGVGAGIFDFGGITEGSHGGEDPLGGISDFKRYFGGAIASVGSEWTLEPRPAAARLVSLLQRVRRRG